MRRRGLTRSVTTVFIVALCLPATVAAATLQTPAIRVDARGGFDGIARRNAAAPLTVLVESDTFFAGTVQVLLQGPSTIERPIELPGGSRKELTFVVPRPNILEVRVLDRTGRTVAKRQPSINQIQNEELIGFLSSAPPPLTRTTVAPLGRDATVVVVTAAVLELGQGALDALSHLVVDAKTVGALSPRQRETVLGFAAAGGELIVAASSETELAFLPAAWRGSGRGVLRRVEVANGHLTVALRPLSDAAWSGGGAMWSDAIRPVDLGRWAGEGESPSQDWLEAITASGGFRGPSIGWLLAFVIGYVALVGPLNFIVLGRLRRRELAWVTVPVLALLFAVGAYVAGRGARNVPILQGAGIVVIDDTFRRDSFALAVLSRGGGDQTVKLAGSWLAEPLPFGEGLNNELPTVRFTRETSEVRFPLAIGAVGTLTARRISLASSPDAGILTASGAAFEGTVKNPLDAPLRNAGVFVGSSFSPIGLMEPGAETSTSVADPTGAGQFVPVELSLEEHFFRFGNPEDIGALYPLIRRAGATAGLGDPGRAFLVGFADLEQVGRSAGLGSVDGTVLVVAPIRLDLGPAKELSGVGIRREVVASDGFFEPSASVEQIFEAREVVLRFELPAGRAAKSLVLDTQQAGQFGGGIIVKPFPRGVAPPDVVGGEGGIELSLYDFAKGQWQPAETGDGRVILSGTGTSRYLSPAGEFYVRLSSEFPQAISAGAFALSAVFA